MGENKTAISYHIFTFPFKWDFLKDEKAFNKTIGERINLIKFKELLCKKYWTDDYLDINEYTDYNQYVYFYSDVRRVIYEQKDNNINNQSDIVKCFKFKKIGKNAKYFISIEKDNSIRKEYSLNLTNIKLKVYKTGVANLIFFTENHNTYLKEEILEINDYGRRIYPQFLPLKDCKNSFLADITLKNIIKTSYENVNFGTKKYDESDFKKGKLSTTINISSAITDVLGKNFICEKYDNIENKIVITPVIDDRMFVMSLIDTSKCAVITSKDCFDDFWYKYIFVDTNSCTCQNIEMKNKLIINSTYNRWSNYGTYYGITRYSFMVAESGGDFGKILVNQFNTMYCEMVLLALTARSSLLRFKEEASRIAILNRNSALKNINDLQKLYICFLNSIYFKEVTAQEQGIEMYDMFLENMRIKKDVNNLDKDISEIYNYTSGIYKDKINKKVNFITVVGCLVGLISLILNIVTFIFQNK